MNNKPILSIVTVTYNAEAVLENTIKSIINQSFKDYEFIIIDGKSDDKTVAVIKKYERHVTYWVSENDKGIYDAMNKGTSKAKGEWIIYMNAGDSFYNEQVLSNVFSNKNLDQTDFIYGGIKAHFAEYSMTYPSQPLTNFHLGKPFHHQAFFARTTLALKKPFDLQYKICADYDFAYYYYNKGAKFQEYKGTIANADFCESAVGSSFWKVYLEDAAVSQKHNISKGVRGWLNIFQKRASIIRIIFVKKILPASVVEKFRAKKYDKKLRKDSSIGTMSKVK